MYAILVGHLHGSCMPITPFPHFLLAEGGGVELFLAMQVFRALVGW